MLHVHDKLFAFSSVAMMLSFFLADTANNLLQRNLDLRKIVATSNFLVHKLFDSRKISQALKLNLRSGKDGHFLTIIEQSIGFSIFFHF